MKTFAGFLEHVMKNFEVQFPYGLSKTEVVRLTFLAWCVKEANIFEGKNEVPKV
ncbi:MAG: hypothetical protein WDA22_08985 [Bacteroidota bacterium]